MIDSIQESVIQQMRRQGRVIRSSMDIYYLSSFEWEDTVEGEIFWCILHYSYTLYSVYDYVTLIKIYIRFNSVPHIYLDILGIYNRYFDKVKGTLSDEGFEKLIKQIGK